MKKNYIRPRTKVANVNLYSDILVTSKDGAMTMSIFDRGAESEKGTGQTSIW